MGPETQYSHCTCAPANPVLKSIKAWKEGAGPFTAGASPVGVLLSWRHQRSRKTRGSIAAQRHSTRMNFAAQLFYSSYLSERLERLYSPRPAIKDSEEKDPFWQRWENAQQYPQCPRFSSHRWQFGVQRASTPVVSVPLPNHLFPSSCSTIHGHSEKILEPAALVLLSLEPPTLLWLPSEKCAHPMTFITSSV